MATESLRLIANRKINISDPIDYDPIDYIPKVKAYDGPLPEGAQGFEFTTNAVPDPGGIPGKPTWSGNGLNPDVQTVNGQAVISCNVTKVNC